MSNHSRKTPTLMSLSKRQWTKIAATFAGVGLLATAGVVTNTFYHMDESTKTQSVTAFSATDTNGSTVSRSLSREDLKGADKNTTFVTVKINGESRVVLGSKDDLTTVKAVLDAGNITLESGDTVSPSLDTTVDESTVITINRTGATLETIDSPIAFNTVYKDTADLLKGEEKVETEGEEGVMETTNLVTRAGDTVVSSNAFASYVKKAPVDRVILRGTGTASSSSSSSSSGSSASIGVTVPASEMQQWAHDYLISNGYTESDFSAAVYIINRESGWNPTATNASSGAYGLAQALPGSKMASAGSDWRTNYQTQFKWFVGYCNGRYGSLSGAYNFWLANHWY